MSRLSRALPLAGLLVAALAATGCVSSQDIEGLQSQLSDIQRQMLQMQKQAQQAPSKQEVADLGSNVGQQMQGLLKTEADMQVKLQGLGTQIEALQAKLEDTNYRLSQLSQQIAATNQDLKSFRGQAPDPAVEAHVEVTDSADLGAHAADARHIIEFPDGLFLGHDRNRGYESPQQSGNRNLESAHRMPLAPVRPGK